MVNGIHTNLWFLIVLPFSFHRVQKQNLSGLKITCGSTRHESGMLSGSQGWTFTRVATDQSQSCWGWRPAPQQPFTENNKITHKHPFSYVMTLVALVISSSMNKVEVEGINIVIGSSQNRKKTSILILKEVIYNIQYYILSYRRDFGFVIG